MEIDIHNKGGDDLNDVLNKKFVFFIDLLCFVF